MKYSLSYRIVSWTFVIILIFSSLPLTVEAATVTGTPLRGTISTDVVLTKANSPYVMDNSYVTVSPGATLTIEPGVQIIGKGNHQLAVNGTLIAQGSKEELITLDNLYISSMNAGEIFLEYVDWSKNGFATLVGKNTTFTMVRSKFSLGTIDLSRLENDSFIEDNLFHNEGTLFLSGGAGRINIVGNTFYNENGTDIYHSCKWDTCKEPNILIENNNFLGPNWHIELSGDRDKTIIAPNNYWGTTIQKSIYGSILDGNDYISDSKHKLLPEPIASTPFPIAFELPKIEEPYLSEGVIPEGNSTFISGIAKNASKAVLKVTTLSGNEVRYETPVNAGRFTFGIPRQQKGTKIELYSYTSNEVSDSVFYTVEKSFFGHKPFVYSVVPDATAIKGVTTPDTNIEIEKNNQVIASGISSATGEFDIPITSLVEGETLRVYAVYGQRKSQPASITVGTPLELEPPVFKEINYLYNQSFLHGITEPNIKIQVRVNYILTEEKTTDAGGRFNINFIGQEDDVVEVTAIDQNNNRSTPVLYTIEDWIRPILNPYGFSNKQDYYRGNSEPGVTISVEKRNVLLASGMTNSDGSFALPIARQAAGTELTVKATDKNGNVTQIIQKVSDDIPPSIESVSTIFEGDTVIIGKGEPASTIALFINNVQQQNKVNVNTDGTFEFEVPLLAVGDEIKLIATDASRNISTPYVLTVQKLEPPKSPIVNSISDYAKVVTGTAKANLFVKVYKGLDVLAEGTSNAKGEFSIPISIQKAGTNLKVVAFNERQLSSEPTTVVVEDKTAPDAPFAWKVTDQSTTITGTSERLSTVVLLKDGVVLTQAAVSESGLYEISIPKQSANTKLELFARDLANNESPKTLITVKDVTAPNVFANPVTNKSTSITGTSNENGTIIVKNGSQIINSTTTTAGKTFTISIPVQKEGVILTLLATDLVGNEAFPIQTVVEDVIAPAQPQVNKVGDNVKEVTGTAEVGAKVYILAGTLQIGYAVSNGTFKAVIPVQKAGTVISVKAYDRAGNASVASNVTVSDVTPPAKPTINVINDKTTSVTGKAEAGATVKVFAGAKQLGYATSNGSFKVVIPIQKAGTVISVKAYDRAGNVSVASNFTVKDVKPPAKPTVNVIKNTTKNVTGKAEAKSKVRIYNGTKLIGIGTTNASGNFTIKIPVQKMGVKLTATATDLAGNKSSATTIVVKDGIAPSVPKVNAVYSTSYYVSGKAEANSTLSIKSGSKIIGSGKVDKYGKFRVKIVRQKRGVTLSITATDAAKNTSKPAYTKVR